MARTKKTSIMLKIILAATLLYLLYVFIGLQVKINEKKEQLSKLDSNITNVTADNERLASILDSEIDKEYVEKIARDMGYVNSDEKVYQSITD